MAKFCAQCSAANDEDARFCVGCGVPIDAISDRPAVGTVTSLPVTPQGASPSGLGRVLKIFGYLVLFFVASIVALLAWIFVPRGTGEWLYAKAEESVSSGASLPKCNSALVERELWARYGKIVSFLNSQSPVALIELRRTKELSFDQRGQTRACLGEYSTPVGLGEFYYTVTWYDIKNPAIDQLTVNVDETKSRMPELIEKANKAGMP